MHNKTDRKRVKNPRYQLSDFVELVVTGNLANSTFLTSFLEDNGFEFYVENRNCGLIRKGFNVPYKILIARNKKKEIRELLKDDPTLNS